MLFSSHSVTAMSTAFLSAYLCLHTRDSILGLPGFLFVCLKNKLFIYLFMAALGLRCFVRAFSSCSERGLLFVAVHGLLISVVYFVAEHGL